MTLLITDLDNTLYDWVTFFAISFQGMVDELATLLDVDRERLLDEFKVLHRQRGSSEQPFIVLDLPSVKEKFGDSSRHHRMKQLDRPLHVFNSLRKKNLHLYESVAETLGDLRTAGVVLVAHTESSAENVLFRLQKLGIVDYFKHLYVLESDYTGHPDPERAAALTPPPGLLRPIPRAERKPNPELLRDICRREGFRPEDAYYVGDSLTRDMSMAKAAGVTAIWARYGTVYEPSLWKILVRVTHWTDEDVAREEELKKHYEQIEPDYTIDSFGRLVDILGLRISSLGGPSKDRHFFG